MSQMTGKIDINLAKGLTICFVGEIVATLQNRHKVVYEIYEKDSLRPLLRVYLNNHDYFIVSIYEQDGTEHSIKPISPNKFAAYYINRSRQNESERASTYVIRLSPLDLDSSEDTLRLRAEVFIDNTLQSSTVLAGRFRGHDIHQEFSIGATSTGMMPATFTLGELYLTNGPMSNDDLSKSAGYLKSKWDIGHDLEYYRTAVKDTRKGSALIVEDKCDKIYKVAWLSLNGISFTAQNIDQSFSSSCNFNIIGMHGAGGVSGFLRAKNPDIYEGNKYVGLFDFDKEGRENFHNLKKESFWPAEICGTKNMGHYKMRLDYNGCAAMLLPIPDRLSKLADISYANFSSYIEIENLLPEEFLFENSFCEEFVTVGVPYLKIKDKCKSSLWRKACVLTKEAFVDFAPLFETVNTLMLKSNDRT